jgi:hypothetical protein
MHLGALARRRKGDRKNRITRTLRLCYGRHTPPWHVAGYCCPVAPQNAPSGAFCVAQVPETPLNWQSPYTHGLPVAHCSWNWHPDG